MKIILSSDINFILNQGYSLTGIPKDEIRIGYVTTASKGAKDSSYINKIKELIRKEGYNLKEIDIEGKSREHLESFFKDKNIIQVEGGNTFYLLKAIRNSYFPELLKNLLNQGRVYIGISAGAYIMCPTIEVANWNENGRDRFGVIDFKALNYLPFILKCHYTDDQKIKIEEKKKSLKYPLKLLRDGQGILFEDGKSIIYEHEGIK